MKVELFLFTRKIGDSSYSVMIPCAGWDDANAFAAHNGWTVDGNNVHGITEVPVPQFMQFLNSLTMDDGINWRPHAEEQIEAFLSCGWPEKTQEQ